MKLHRLVRKSEASFCPARSVESCSVSYIYMIMQFTIYFVCLCLSGQRCDSFVPPLDTPSTLEIPERRQRRSSGSCVRNSSAVVYSVLVEDSHRQVRMLTHAVSLSGKSLFVLPCMTPRHARQEMKRRNIIRRWDWDNSWCFLFSFFIFHVHCC